MTSESSPSSGGNVELKNLGESILDRFTKGFSALGDPRSLLKYRLLQPSSLPELGLLAVFSALCGTGIVFVLNQATTIAQNKQSTFGWGILFIAILLGFRIGQKALIARTSGAVEQALDGWRGRISRKVTELSLRDLEEMTRGRIIDGLARSYEQLSQTIVPLVGGVESIVLLVFTLIYLCTLSLIAGLIMAAIAVSLVYIYVSTAHMMKETMKLASEADAELARLAEDMVDGFKELKLSQAKCIELHADMAPVSQEVAVQRSRTGEIISELIAVASSSGYLLAAAVVFVLPILAGGGEGISRIVTAVLFLLSPIGGVIGAGQQIVTARFAIDSIRGFEESIDKCLRASDQQGPDYSGFSELSLAGVGYRHATQDGEAGFAVNDVSAVFSRGQIVFVTGANGSGKTTALRLLTGLYPIQTGMICVDGQPVTNPPPQSYRDLFATVFFDYHIFRKPYALDVSALARLEEALVMLRIRDKCPENLAESLNRDALSTGQRKRLALALALAEDRPIILLDEWAADQDPGTRERFYHEILPALSRAGKTIIAVTHDERYFDCADIRYHMDEGHLHRVMP
jgi:putative ATP-binding cassette transporter